MNRISEEGDRSNSKLMDSSAGLPSIRLRVNCFCSGLKAQGKFFGLTGILGAEGKPPDKCFVFFLAEGGESLTIL